MLYFDDPFVINNLSNRLYKANQVGNDHNSDNVSLLKNSIIDTLKLSQIAVLRCR